MSKAATTPSSGKTPSMASNVLANWAGHFLLIVSGFILPRIIDSSIGTERLGVWDFGWSTIAYFRLMTMGVGSSVNRYVARYRGLGDISGLNRAVSSCGAIFATAATIALTVTLLLTYGAPAFLPGTFAPYLVETQWLILFLGLGTALTMSSMAFSGVITGCQRYDLINAIEAGSHLAAVVLVLVALLTGMGLQGMAVGVFLARVLEAGLKYLTAYRVCAGLSVRPRHVSRAGLGEIAGFGSKSLLHELSKLTLYQGNSLLVAFFLGPQALAFYARPMALIMHANKLLFQFGRVLVPKASNLQAANNDNELAALLIKATRYSMYIALPLVLFLAVMWKPLLTVWMGADFAQTPVLCVLAIGHLAVLCQSGAFFALLGMNRHGIPAMAALSAAVLSVCTSWVWLWLGDGGLLSVAFSVGVSLTLVNTLVVPLVVARSARVSLWRYLGQTWPRPLLAVMPFALWIGAVRALVPEHHISCLLLAMGGGGLSLLAAYWHGVLPDSIKLRITAKLSRRPAASSS